MSDYVDDVLDGSCCQQCGVLIGMSVGYPRDCAECDAPKKTVGKAKKIRADAKENQDELF